MQDLFRIRRDERWLMVITVVVILFFQCFYVGKYFPLFANYDSQSWHFFTWNFQMGGLDPITYTILTDWHQGYEIFRHPLLAPMMYPLYLLNQLLWAVTGMNCAMIIMAVVLTACYSYSMLFLYRICRDVVGIGRGDAMLLTAFFGAFGYILASALAPDHFMLSLFLILLTLWRAGVKHRQGDRFSLLETVVLFTLATGITLTDSAIIALAVWYANGRATFRPRFLLAVFVVPSILIVGIAVACQWQEGVHEEPVERQMKDAHADLDRGGIFVENFLGESIQLHRRYLLQDALIKRPVVVRYSWKAQYVAEAAYTLLFILGILAGRRSRYLWLMMGILAFNILLYFPLGFGLNEVQIMTCHWAFVIPIAMAYLFRPPSALRVPPSAFRLPLLLLTVYLWLYDIVLFWHLLTWPLKMG